MEGRETDLEYNLLMGLTGASVSKHLLDEHFTLLWANDFYYDMIGYPKEEYEALFHNKPDLYFKGYDEAWNILSKNVYETIANKASGYETVIQMPTRKGKRWTKITSTFTDQLQDGIPISYTVMTDVEDVMRRRIEQTITYDNIPGFISKHKVHKDGSFTLLEANDKYMDFSGIDKNSFLSFSPFSRLDETSRNTMNAHISCMLKGEPVHFVIQSKDKNGNGAWLQLNGECIGWEGDEPIYLIVYINITDITEQRELQKKLEKQSKQLKEALKSAEQANQAKSDFLARMSHDIRTPMNAIMGITSLIRHDAGNKDKVIEYVDKIDVSAQHLLGIINDVLDMSKIEAGKTVFSYSDFSILEFMQEIQTMFCPQTEEKHQSLVIHHENIVHEWVNSDYVHLMQIFSNLLSNAVKYTQKGGKIQFLVEECETKSSAYAKYHFAVIDNGVGMSEDFKDKIFDTFTREESSLTNKIQGTGLGMAITKNLIEAMGGTIDVDSELGLGSCFEVFMDLKIAEESVSSALQVEESETYDDIMKGMRFLCAEDNELNAEILTELLKIKGAECTVCENGERILETFERSASGDYDMILMDVQMPVMNGYEATKAIRKSSHEQAKTIPIIAMTANAFSDDIHHSLTVGMNAHISKPVEMKVLEKTISSIKFGGGLKRRLLNNKDEI